MLFAEIIRGVNVIIKLIAAVNNSGYIGNNGKLLYSIPSDLKRFKALTQNHTVVMGRKTWESLPEKYRPLPNRHNVILSRDVNYKHNSDKPNVEVQTDLQTYLKSQQGCLKVIWIIGGSQIYQQAIKFAGEAHISLIDDDTKGDAYLPILPKGEFICTDSKCFSKTQTDPAYTYLMYVRRTH